ncbi:MAG TPA: hypothetical protein VKA10_10180, partial [Prolixibacteraceae bacterium]|nr:hypothetical protein [Prolixibacteraceae bacterium]
MKNIYIFLTILCLVIFAGLKNSSGVEVGNERKVGSSTIAAIDPQVVFCSGENKFLVVWTGNESGTDRIFYNFQSESGLVGVPSTTGTALSTAPAGTYRYAEKPQVAYDQQTGKAAVVWIESYAEGKDSVVMKTIDAGSNTIGSEVVIASGSTWNMSAALSGDDNGNFLVAYFDTTGNDITAKMYDSAGIQVGDSITLGSVGAGYVLPYSIDIEYNSTEELYLVSWSDVTTNLFAITVDVLGNKGTLRNYSGITSAANPAIAYNDSTNQFLVAYDDFNGNVKGYLTDSVGNLVGSEIIFEDSTLPAGGFPDVAFNSTNTNFVITWQEFPGGNGIWLQEYNTGACPVFTTPVKISSTSTSNAPSVSYGSTDENYWILWFGLDAKDEIFAQRYSTDLTEISAICQDITVYLDANGEYILSADSIDGGSSAICGIDTITLSKDTLNLSHLPSTTVELIVTDVNGLKDTCEALVTVIDTFIRNQPPVAICVDSLNVFVENNCEVFITASDLDNGSTDPDGDELQFSLGNNGPYTPGTYQLKLVVSDGQLSDTCDTKITVLDTIAPIPPQAPADLNLQCASDVPPPVDLTATDNCDGDITVSSATSVIPGSCPNDFVLIREWNFEDSYGNVSSVSQTITVTDTLAPAAPNPPANLNLECADDVPPPVNLTATDNCDGAITVSPTTQITPGSCLNDFVIVRTWTFADTCGNVSSVSQTISVVDTLPPLIQGP